MVPYLTNVVPTETVGFPATTGAAASSSWPNGDLNMKVGVRIGVSLRVRKCDCVCECVISGCLSAPCRVQCNFVLGYDGVLHWSASIERKSDAELIQDAKFSVSKWKSSGINNKGCCVGTFQGNMEDQNAWDLASIGPSGACFTFIIRPSTSDLYVQATRAVCLPRQLHTVDINHGGRGGSLSLLSG